MYELENIGWKITAINNSMYAGGRDYNITHRIHLPFGMILQRKTIKEVVEFIVTTFLSPCKFVGETLETSPRREYSFKHSYDQEGFAKLWNGVEVNATINGNWHVFI